MKSWIVALLLTISSITPCTAEDLATPLESEVIEWLPADIETLLVARASIKYPSVEQIEQSCAELEMLPIVAPAAIAKHIQGKKLSIAVDGGSGFKSPKICGAVNEFDGCQIIVFEETLNLNVSDVFESGYCQDHVQVAFALSNNWTDPDYFVAIPKENVLVITTEKKYMSTILHRMKVKSSNRAMPKDLPEWNSIKRDSTFYAIRHYQPCSEDEMSPYSKNSEWLRVRKTETTKAVGFTISKRSKSAKPLEAYFYSTGSDQGDSKTFASVFAVKNGQGSVRNIRVSKGCFRIRIPTLEPDKWTNFIQCLSMLGYSPYF